VKRLKNILFISNGEFRDDAALEHALHLAKTNKTRLSVAEVIEELPRDMLDLAGSMKIDGLQELMVRDSLKELRNYIARIKPKEMRVPAKILVGIPFLEIIREVLRKKHRLVMIDAERKGEFGELLFGSTTMHLMRKCPCPVWVVKPTESRRYMRIVAAVDPDPFDAARDALNSRIMELASRLVEAEEGRLHVVHAWSLSTRKILLSRNVPQEEIELMSEETERVRRARVEALVEKFAAKLPQTKVHIVEGEAGSVIPQLATEVAADLVVMGTVSRTGIAGFLIGNSAERVLRHVDCSVLAVKPEGFETPVTLGEPDAEQD
jgi:nucleotide-binding universal stress UspA family protein